MMPARAVCPLCDGADCAIVYDLTAVSSPEDVPGLVARCNTCLMWFKRLVDPNGIPKEYPGEYGDDALAQTYLLGAAARMLFRETLAQVNANAHAARPRLLDVGAGQGVLLEEAVRMGFAAEGIDHCVSNVQTARAKGLEVREGAAEDLDDYQAFDVITMMDIIEHVQDPLRVLKNAQRALKPTGELVVYTPNHRAAIVVLARLLNVVGIRSPVGEIFGRNHVCFFDDRSLPMALHKAGFDVRLQQQLPYDASRPGQPMSPLSLAAVTVVDWLGRPLHRSLRMLAYARRSLAAPTRAR